MASENCAELRRIAPSCRAPFADSISIFKSLATRASSAFPLFSSVMSWPTPTTPEIWPWASRRVAALRRISTRSPFFEYSGNSKLAVSFPFSAFCSTSTTRARSSLWMNSSRRRPTTSHFERPVSCVAFLFHSVMSAVALIPKIGAAEGGDCGVTELRRIAPNCAEPPRTVRAVDQPLQLVRLLQRRRRRVRELRDVDADAEHARRAVATGALLAEGRQRDRHLDLAAAGSLQSQ